MTQPFSPLTPTDLIASASGYLSDAGYTQIRTERLDGLRDFGGRFFEDGYNVVMLVVFNTWSELHRDWTETQASLVELISAHMTNADAKAWDGYLVLLTPDPCPTSQRSNADAIRYDTFRVRKLVAAGDELRTLGEVRRVLLPLLPLEGELQVDKEGSVLDLLPDVLSAHGIAPETTKILLGAFQDKKGLVETLHDRDNAK